MKIEEIAGEYYLSGVPEMAAGFRLNDNYSFEFFYVYGASDRKASGKFEISGHNIILHGTKLKGNDFKLLNKGRLENGFSVRIFFENKMFVKNVVCFFYGNGEPYVAETNQSGIAVAAIDKCHKIELIHSFFPDFPTIIELDKGNSNCFDFTLNSMLEDVVFENHMIEIEGRTFKCSNVYLFGQNPVQFTKR